MRFYVLLTFNDGSQHKMCCTSRAEARQRRGYYLRTMAGAAPGNIKTATVKDADKD